MSLSRRLLDRISDEACLYTGWARQASAIGESRHCCRHPRIRKRQGDASVVDDAITPVFPGILVTAGRFVPALNVEAHHGYQRTAPSRAGLAFERGEGVVPGIALGA